LNHDQQRAGMSDDQRPTALRWYQTVTREQWKVLLAAELGWMLDAMDFVLYLTALTTLQQEFGYGPQTAGWLATMALLASAVGGLVFGVVADRVGRTRALSATIVIFSLGSLGTATAQSVAQLIAWRTLAGLGLGGEWASGAVLVSETWPPAHRDKAISIMQSGWALGYLLAALLTAAVLPVLGWRWLFAIGALPALFVFWVRREVPEPEVWLARRQSAVPAENRLRALFGRALWSRTLLATLLTGTVMFGYWGLFSWLPGFLASSAESGGAGMSIQKSMAWIVPLQIGAFFGYLSFGFLADAVGRRRTFIFFLLTAAALVPLYGHMAHRHAMLLALGPLLGFFGHGYFSLFGATLAELYPTALRATGQGFTYGAGRGLSALAPYTIGTLAQRHGIGPALALTSAFFVAGAGLILLLPQTPRRLDNDVS
jgi:MFS family permease